MTFHGKTVVVTGVSSGIGADTAKLMRLQGARVIGIDRNSPTLSLDGFVRADLSEKAAIDDAIAMLPDHVDALANIAGVPGTVPADTVARVNFLGLRHLTLKLIERMPEGAAVVNISSALGRQWADRLPEHRALAETPSFEAGLAWLTDYPPPQDTYYQYMKEALIVWTLTQSQKIYLERGIRVNCVAPGAVFTPILGNFVQMLGQDHVAKEAGRVKRPAFSDEIASVVAFLCSDAARGISGVNLPVDGGLSSTYI
ncbi:coniferyl-alcohol dehydrogenase [Paraburkholderia sp. HP33-1]|uniref:coniferyl-alcohol dehydrogenase n=1 Tax=Paraburkholderia sp. HP33-1 TaxID=2883243 RepID=UPI001F400990|nr:coniferyl-alcohol dehydrogenase [Paraburkholderia sp. HP33-1]